MLGLILDFNWNNSKDDMVKVTRKGDRAQLQALPSVNTSKTVTSWPRSEVILLETRSYNSDFGGSVVAHICALEGMDLTAELDFAGEAA